MRKEMKMSKFGRRIGTVACLALLCTLGAASTARADVPIFDFQVKPSTTQAGGHPDIYTFFHIANHVNTPEPPPSCECNDAKDIKVEFPTGVIGYQRSTPQCSAVDFGAFACPSDTQVGLAHLHAGNETPEQFGLGDLAVYNLAPHTGQAGLLGFYVKFLEIPIYIVISARTGSDYGLDATITNIQRFSPITASDITLWGVPASPAHDEFRQPKGCDPVFGEFGGIVCTPGVPSNSPEKVFLSNPTTCGVPLSASLEVTAYDKGVTRTDTDYPSTTGCDQLSFNPSLFAQPTTSRTDSPSGLEADLQVPASESASVPSPSEIRATSVTLPPGFSINASAADGKTACRDADAAFGTEGEAHCPDNAKIGTVAVVNQVLPGTLPGSIYLGEPLPGNRYRIFITASGFATNVKIAGTIEPDPGTGQVTVRFPDLPETAFSEFNMHFFGSERGVLATATHCGTYSVDSIFTPWDSVLPEQSSSQFFDLDASPDGGACPTRPRPLAPLVNAGVADGTAGAHSSFAFRVERNDGDQNLSGLGVTTPPGFTATLAGVPYCPEAVLAAVAAPGGSGVAEQANRSCPLASRIGAASTGVGAGTHIANLAGEVYLAGPYKGAPLSLAVVTPAVSGPYDLGNVVVRAALHVNPVTAQVTAISDPLPQIVEGIPLRMRSILVDLDRPNFTLNPTSCDPFAVLSSVNGDEGEVASRSNAFQVGSCTDLPFEPRLGIKLRGRPKRNAHPAIQAVLRAKPGAANISRAAVTLPPTTLLDQSHIRTICTRVQFAAKTCPPGSVYGYAVAQSPLLDQPLRGAVYLRSSSHNLPDLIADLHGQVDVTLGARIDSVRGGLRTTFAPLPDVPVSKFVLRMQGGKKGLVVNSEDLCETRQRAVVRMFGQNGKRMSRRVNLQRACGKGRKNRRAKHSRARVSRARKAG